jgi:hypothetical protein
MIWNLVRSIYGRSSIEIVRQNIRSPNPIWFTTHHDQSSYQRWPQRSCIHMFNYIENAWKRSKSHNSYKNRWIKIVGYEHQHIMTNHSTKYENFRTNDLKLHPQSITILKMHENINLTISTKIVESKWQDMINKTSWPIILPNMEAYD